MHVISFECIASINIMIRTTSVIYTISDIMLIPTQTPNTQNYTFMLTINMLQHDLCILI